MGLTPEKWNGRNSRLQEPQSGNKTGSFYATAVSVSTPELIFWDVCALEFGHFRGQLWARFCQWQGFRDRINVK